MSLALSTLLYEWRRYFAAVIALAVAGLLVLAMTGMFMGMAKSFTATVDKSPAHLLVLPPQAEGIFGDSGQPRRMIPMVYQHPEVIEVQPMQINWAMWSNFPKDGQPPKGDGVRVVVVDPIKGAVTLPSDFSDQIIEALQEPYAVVVDRSSLGKLGVQVGDKAKMNGRTVTVAGVVDGYPNMFNTQVFSSFQTAKLLYVADDGPRVGPLLVKLRDPSRAKEVAAELDAIGAGQFRAWTRDELSKSSQTGIMKEGGIAIMVGFMALVGVFIGIVITWQTLQGAIMANIKEFASLRALGVSMGSLRLIIMELSFWVGVAGLMLTVVLVAGVAFLAKWGGVPMDFPLFIDIPVAIMLMVIAILSGMFSLGVLKKSQPADLLR
ncbi:permease family protein [Asticcacaulis biprosthecium C19]|uniref:Permease family protein n=1 Tax=Asticcacaulis biprosthecium C19 TaxID=715226 RepID=F4QL27_9CAUL|nr:ABC transporter permease [Asticcacaulis biprosthecium]EGF93402.1 permease family protein [Asticcacaulis biprosthecium C19]